MPSRAVVPRHVGGRGVVRRLDLSGIYHNCIFRSMARTNSHSRLAQMLGNDHELQWGAGSVDSALFGVEAPRLKLIVLRYGPQVTIYPQSFTGFSLVQMPLRGSMQIQCGCDDAMSVEVGQAAIINHSEAVRLTWSEGCEQVILRVPHSMLSEAAQHSSFSHKPIVMPIGAVHLLDDASSSEWVTLVQALLNSLLPSQDPQREITRHPAWIDHMERSLALFTLLQMHRESKQHPTEKKSAMQSPDEEEGSDRQALHESEYRMEVIRHHVMKKLGAPLSLEDLARAVGVSPRTVYIDSMRQHGVGPMAWLRGLRLDTARQKILGDPVCNVTDIAIECGFGHLGRFASYYRERFSELPSETAQKSRRTIGS